MRVLVTSFEAFQNFDSNPSFEVMNELRRDQRLHSLPDVEIVFRSIEVSWNAVSLFIDKSRLEHFDLILHMGVATGERNTRIELMGRNVCSGTDVHGKIPDVEVIKENAANEYTNISLPIINKLLVQFGFVKISDNAGSYLCNYIYYKSLCAFRNNSLVVFVHIADYQNNQDAVGLAEQVGFVREMIFELINQQLRLS